MIQTLGEWTSTANLTQISTFEDLRDLRVAIEAGEYLRSKRLVGQPPFEEPLLAALGGVPFTLRHVVKRDVEELKNYGIEPVFVFSGLDAGEKADPFKAAAHVSGEIERAWKLYSQNNAQDAVKAFGSSGAPKVEDFYRFLQLILAEEQVTFQVAPYSATAQLAYLVSEEVRLVDVVSGPADLLLWDVDRVITHWDFKNAHFTWVQRGACLAELGSNISPDNFVDACLLSGWSSLPPLPQLLNRPSQKYEMKRAIDLIQQYGKSGYGVCMQFKDEPRFQDLNYLHRYQKTRMAVKHHVVFTPEGKAVPLNQGSAPNDVHMFVGQRLPDELYFYLSKGVIGPRVLNWITSGQVLEYAPLDVGTSRDYRRLVQDKLSEIREPTLSLLSQSLFHSYEKRIITLRCWFDTNNEKVILEKDKASLKPLTKTWRVSAENFGQSHSTGLLGFAVSNLRDASFASKSISVSVGKDVKALDTNSEVLSNSLWRMLQLRQYVDNEHKLTEWGNVLATALSAVDGRPGLEEPIFLAVELLRFDLLNPKFMFDGDDGALFTGSEIDKRNALLATRVASLGSLRHKAIGFTGPLSRHLLGYNSVISAVRNSLRDLTEVCVTTLLLNGDAAREQIDFTTLGLALPFLLPNDCALGLAMKTHIEGLLSKPQPVSQEHRAEASKMMREYFPYAIDFSADLQTAFVLWDAAYTAVQAAGRLVKDRKVWDEANAWLGAFRYGEKQYQYWTTAKRYLLPWLPCIWQAGTARRIAEDGLLVRASCA